jgi:ATP-dependent RNA helicase SUPV3L1/SUV3
MSDRGRVIAVLGPTNTGKTHYAIERMLAHRTGIIGLPLRLLAREVYDRIVALRGPSMVALVTGEERIVPDRAAWWVCTVEAMPQEIGADFIAIDEIQLCADPERGHVFTDRLLKARGLHETLFLGSDTMRPAIAGLVPGVTFIRRERYSELSYTGEKKLSRMPPRSAIVGFSVENVYAIAEVIRRQKGGCAVVMGALSPRTRNAQVDLYQNGDVDYLVATDAIGMGLNLDVKHVAFSATRKFDGRRMRDLWPSELAQIAGRAGRHTTNGSFGVTGEARPLAEEVVEAITTHSFVPVRKLEWRNSALDFGSVDRLIASLESSARNEWLGRARESDDLLALKALSAEAEVRGRLSGPRDVQLLWDVCRVPDFRGISEAEHATLLRRLFGFLHGGGGVPTDWLSRAIARIDRTDGDIDTLSKRLAYIRTWTYVAQRRGWVADEAHWRGETRAVEDRLSDALHGALTQRFVDRRTSVLLRRLKAKEDLVAEVNDKGEVTVEGEFVGRLEGFRFRQDASSGPDEARTLRQASLQALRPEFHLRADKFYNAPDTELDYTEQGGLMWGDQAVGKLVAGPEPMRPGVEAFVDDEAGPEVAEKVKRRLQHFIDRKVATLYEPLLAMGRDEALSGLARGFAFRLAEQLGVLPRDLVAEDVKALDQDARGALRKHGVRFGQYTIFLPPLLKPAPTRLRLVLWSLANGLQEFPESPPPGLVTIPNVPGIPATHYTLAGYRPAGERAIRIDMLERLADMIRPLDSKAGFEATPDMLSITGMTLDQFATLMQGLGYAADKGERPKRRAPAEPAPGTPVVSLSGDPVAEEPGTVPGANPEPLPEATAETGSAPEAETTPTADPVSDASSPASDAAPVEMEPFYSFTWAPRRAPRGDRPRGPRREGQAGAPRGDRNRTPAMPDAAPAEGAPAQPQTDRGPRPDRGNRPGGNRQGGQGPRDGGKGDKPFHKGKSGDRPGDKADRGDRPRGKDRPREDAGPKTFEARPPRKDRIDPDNPFAAALMGFQVKK